MAQLVRCKPCGYVMRADKLGDVCPACGLPAKVFEPFRETISQNRKKILGLDLHPIAIHLSQTFTGLIAVLLVFINIFPDLYYDILIAVLSFSIIVLPFSVVIAIISGLIDGLTRFKSLKPPLLRIKIIAGSIMLVLSTIMAIITKMEEYTFLTFVLSYLSLACAVLLGLWGKKLITVILPGSYKFKLSKRKK